MQSLVSFRIQIALREAGGGKFSGLSCHLRMEHKHNKAAAEGAVCGSPPLPAWAIGTCCLYSVLFH